MAKTTQSTMQLHEPPPSHKYREPNSKHQLLLAPKRDGATTDMVKKRQRVEEEAPMTLATFLGQSKGRGDKV